MNGRNRHSGHGLLAVVALAAMFAIGVLVTGFSMLGGLTGQALADCDGGRSNPAAIALQAPGGGATVGATEYGGPGDPSSGTVGSSGVNLERFPDSYAELGGNTFTSADALGGLPYGTPLRITWGQHSAIAYKRDIGLGGGPIDGHPRVIDLWWQLAKALGIPYENGEWSGLVRLERPPLTGAGNTLGKALAADPSADTGEPPRVRRRSVARCRSPTVRARCSSQTILLRRRPALRQRSRG
jgi:hypothetical protein